MYESKTINDIGMKLSLKYRVLRTCMKATGMKKRLSGTKEEILKMAGADAAKKKIPQLKHPKLDITVRKFDGEDVVYMTHKQKTDRVCIFLIGGGMIKYPRPDALKKAMKICLETGRDFIVPYYPLCINQSVKVAYNFMYRLYKETLQQYKAENILLCGSSSGAYLALGLVSHINAMDEGLPIPGKIYASSPGTCFNKQEEWDEAWKLNETDFLIDARYMETAKDIMTHGEDILGYMGCLDEGNYKGLKEVYLCYGGHETLYAACKPILSSLKRDGVKVTLEVGEGMFHCYPFFPLCKEAKRGWDKMIAFLKG